jgi:hypothetical protein
MGKPNQGHDAESWACMIASEPKDVGLWGDRALISASHVNAKIVPV